jgi:hypothetical protein
MTSSIRFAMSARSEVLNQLNCMGLQTPWSSFLPEPVVLYPMIALLVSSILNVNHVKSGCCGLFENCWGTFGACFGCDGCCDWEQGCSTTDALCDCANYCSCKNCELGSATQFWQVFSILIAITGIGYAIGKGYIFPRATLPADYMENTSGKKIVQKLNQSGRFIQSYDWLPHFIFPAVAIGFAVWSTQAKDSQTGLKLSGLPLAANIITIIVSVLAISWGVFAYRRTPMFQIPFRPSAIKEVMSLGTSAEFNQLIANVAKEIPQAFENCKDSSIKEHLASGNADELKKAFGKSAGKVLNDLNNANTEMKRTKDQLKNTKDQVTRTFEKPKKFLEAINKY